MGNSYFSRGLSLLLAVGLNHAILGTDLEQVLAKCADGVQKVSAISLDSSCIINGKHRSSRYLAQGGKFRLDIKMPDGNTTSSAFNGLAYQEFTEKTSMHVTSSTTMKSSHLCRDNPVFIAYEWLFEASDELTLSRIRNSEAWLQLAKRSQLIEEGAYKGHPCEVVVVNHNRSFPTKVFFAKDLLYLPLAAVTSTQNGSEAVRTEVLDYLCVTTDAGPVYLPIAVERRQFAVAGVLAAFEQKASIVPASLKVNCAIDESEFTLSSSRARRVIDADEMRDRFAERIDPIPYDSAVRRKALVVVGIVVCVAAVAWIARRRFV
jgi:hypothetical protein